MSECVVRMEMPEKCGKCPLAWYYGAGPCFCMVSLERNDAVDDGMMWKEAEPNKKPQWCPILCQLPEGHGDLVDWKDVEKELDTSFCSVVDDGPCMGPYMLKRKEYPQALIERPIRVNIIVPAEK